MDWDIRSLDAKWANDWYFDRPTANVSVVNFPRHGIAVDDHHKKMCPLKWWWKFTFVFVHVLFRFIGFMFHIDFDAGTWNAGLVFKSVSLNCLRLCLMDGSSFLTFSALCRESLTELQCQFLSQFVPRCYCVRFLIICRPFSLGPNNSSHLVGIICSKIRVPNEKRTWPSISPWATRRYFGVSDDKSDRLMRADLTGHNLEEFYGALGRWDGHMMVPSIQKTRTKRLI